MEQKPFTEPFWRDDGKRVWLPGIERTPKQFVLRLTSVGLFTIAAISDDSAIDKFLIAISGLFCVKVCNKTSPLIIRCVISLNAIYPGAFWIHWTILGLLYTDPTIDGCSGLCELSNPDVCNLQSQSCGYGFVQEVATFS